MRAHHIIACFYPAAPVAAFAAVAFAPVTDQAYLAVPLAMPCTVRAHHIQVPPPRLHGDSVKRMKVLRTGAMDDAGRVVDDGALSLISASALL